MKQQLQNERLYYLDWLRVFAVILLIPFHTGMIFVDGDFHLKNKVTSTGLTLINAFIDNWHMPLFFFLAGASTWFALNKRRPVAYIKERFSRLFIPLLFGIIFIVPPQTYYERIQKSEFSGSYFDFYAHLFNGIYPEGNLNWNHLWFLFYLLIISLAVLPLIWHWKSGRSGSYMESFCIWLAQGHRIFSLCIPLAIIQMSLKVAFPGPQNIVSDWARILFMLCIFLYGALFFSYPGYREAVERNFSLAFVTGIVILSFFVVIYYSGYRFVFGYNIPNLLQLGFKSLATMCWLIVILGFSQRNLNFNNHLLEYGSEAVLAFYILHQTAIIVLGYHIVNTDLPLLIKYIIINLLAFIVTVAIYHTTVQRFRVLRVLFGMPFRAKKRLQPMLAK
jgi:glucan biosynthesis protein C